MDVRIITATNRDLEQAISQGIFREDLYYRLNVVTLHLPPLRQRGSDIEMLADYFLKQFCKEMNKKPKNFSPEAMEMLQQHPWRGNVRELKNVVERAVIFAETPVLDAQSLGREFSPGHLSALPGKAEDESLQAALDRNEATLITQALERSGHNKTQAAARLGISRFALNRRLQRLGLEG